MRRGSRERRQPLFRAVGQNLQLREGIASVVIDFLLPSGLDTTFQNWLGRANNVWEEELRWLDHWEQLENLADRRPREARRAAFLSGLATVLDWVG